MDDPLHVRDEDLERLLAGKAPAGDGELEDLQAFVQAVRESSVILPAAAVERRHLAAIIEASRLAIDKDKPAVRPASKASRPEWQASGLPKWRRRTMLGSLFASLSAKIAAAGIGVAMATTGGLAVTGNLPSDVQKALSEAAETVGISIPDGLADSTSGQEAASRQDAERRQDAGNRQDEADAGKRVDAVVRDAIETTSPGPERGSSVSEAASQNRRDGEQGANTVPPADTPVEYRGPSDAPRGMPENPSSYRGPTDLPTSGNPTGVGGAPAGAVAPAGPSTADSFVPPVAGRR